MTLSIAVFVINLARRTDRLKRMTEHLRARGLTFERIDACDARTVDAATLDGVIANYGPPGPLGAGDRACTVSHTLAWRKFTEGTSRPVLFLEVGIFLAADVSSLLCDTAWFPSTVDLIKFEKYGRGTSRLLLRQPLG